jgi:glycosyltransferase involved in cell wall biosynthesis
MSAEQDKRPKRHCMVVHAYYPVGETRVQREALALVSRGYKVDVLCLRGEDEPSRDEEDGVRIYRLPLKRHKGRGLLLQMLEYLAFFALAFGKLVQLCFKRRYGTVQVHNLPDFLVFSALLPKVMGASIILDLHDLMPEFFAAKTESEMTAWPVRLVTWQEQLSCRFADHVITVTDVWKETLIQRGVPAHKVSVVMNVADSSVFRRIQDRPARNGQGFGLIYHGTFTHRYGVDLIVRAIEQVRMQIPDIHLTLLGRGESLEELIQLTESLNLQKHVTMGGTLHVSKLPPLILQADVGIVPNRSNIFTDGLLPTKLMEYVAMGTPVIAARTPTIAAYFDDTMIQFFEPGSVDALAHSIVELYKDRRRLAELVEKSDAFNRRYNWDRVAANYVALVDQLS